MRKSYRLSYRYKGHVIPYKESIPTHAAARIVMEKTKRSSFSEKDTLHIEEYQENLPKRKPCRFITVEERRRPVLNRDYLYADALRPGMLVESDIVYDYINCLPPASMRSDCMQMGEPYDSVLDADRKVKETYLTFKRFDENTFVFCGHCVKGKNTETGVSLTKALKRA